MSDDVRKRSPREGSAIKRAGILAAARELFLDDGFERTSTDAVAARAVVSKRTVYDYFGDKRAVLVAVVTEAGASLMASVHAALDRHLTDVTAVEPALVSFARQVATDTFWSSDFAVLRRLSVQESQHLVGTTGHWLANAPEDAIAARFAALTVSGHLNTPDPRLAADHFVALTFLLALDSVEPGAESSARVDRVITRGVPAFVRAYATSGRDGSPARAADGARE